jgi:hypothetical protein
MSDTPLFDDVDGNKLRRSQDYVINSHCGGVLLKYATWFALRTS